MILIRWPSQYLHNSLRKTMIRHVEHLRRKIHLTEIPNRDSCEKADPIDARDLPRYEAFSVQWKIPIIPATGNFHSLEYFRVISISANSSSFFCPLFFSLSLFLDRYRRIGRFDRVFRHSRNNISAVRRPCTRTILVFYRQAGWPVIYRELKFEDCDVEFH